MAARLVAGIAGLLVVLVGQAEASARCGARATAWVAACAERQGISLAAARCPPGRLIVAADSLEIELTPPGTAGFLEQAGATLAPIGDYPDWDQAAAPARFVFDAVAACAASSAVPFVDLPAPARDGPRRAPWPWSMLLGLAGAAALAVTARPRRARVLQLSALCAATLLARLALVAPGFFHQNGQGALWIDFAVGHHSGLDALGVGYRQVFGLLASARPADADTAVFLAQAACGALMPALAWIICRRARAHPQVCWAVAFVVAIDPSLARVAHSESYLATIAFALMLAAAALAEGLHRGSWRTWRAWLGIATAAVLIAQAARVHPIGWIPAALVPLVAVALPVWPTWQRAVRAGLVAGASIGLAVVALDLPAMVRVTDRELTGTMLSRLSLPPAAFVVAAVLAVAAIHWRVPARSAVLRAAGVALVALGVLLCTELLPYDYAWVRHAGYRLYLPALVAAIAAACAPFPHRAAVLSVAIALAGTAHAAAAYAGLTVRPTDVRESAWVSTWRSELDTGAAVIYLARAGQRTYALPIYTGPIVALSAGDLTAASPAPNSYYYRSSLCATPEGQAACAEFEARHSMAMIRAATLPGVASQPWAPVDAQVEVSLWRITGPR